MEWDVEMMGHDWEGGVLHTAVVHQGEIGGKGEGLEIFTTYCGPQQAMRCSELTTHLCVAV